MVSSFNSRRLDVAAFAQAGGHLSGQLEVQALPRLAQELGGRADARLLHWQLQGERRSAVDGSVRPALHLQAQLDAPLTCQRCLGALDERLTIDRHFIFVPDEDTAAAMDDASEDDVLALNQDFDLYPLLEDELLMALPLVPRHERCPEAVTMQAESEGFAQEQARVQRPFAALAALKRKDG